MSFVLCFNERSAHPPAADRRAGSQRAETLARLLAAVVRERPELRTQADFWQTELAPGFTLGRWVGAADTPREVRQFLLKVGTNSPLLSGEPANLAAATECLAAGGPGAGLTAAFVLGGVSVSFDVGDPWRGAWLTVLVRTLDATGEFLEKSDKVAHASTAGEALGHADLRRAAARAVGPDVLWARRVALFPRLEFCPSVERDLLGFLEAEPAWSAIVERLGQLDVAAAAQFAPDSLPKCTPESRPTLDAYKAEHTFSDRHGGKHLFSWHLRFTPGVGRIFFIPRPDAPWLVGTVSRNGLPTVRDPT